ncbi:hypothetical protein GHJ84_29680 [Sinorhizobium meliloti]|uniref:hypothetical protein n=1 Tax=Rhizobium meliloti TaxID=382 RepID=UPI0012961AA9|nr:hypothetical protein [Sinorhizobium meliloti]MQX25035.1 hypothetical protein [Sinorhizobium meliloti]
MLPSWMGNGFSILAFTVFMFIIGHAAFYVWGNEQLRKIIAYAALLVGGGTILTSFVTSESVVNSTKSELLSYPLNRSAKDLEDRIGGSISYLCGFNAVKLPSSPPNFDEIEAERRQACDIVKEFGRYARSEWKREGHLFVVPDAGQRDVTDVVWKNSVETVVEAAKYYNSIVDEMNALKPERWLFWAAVEPFLLAFSWCAGLVAMGPTRKRHGR